LKVIIINGKPRSGKDTFVDLFTKMYNYRVKNFSSVDLIKDVIKKHFDWNGEKNHKSRKFISDIKKSWIEFNDGPKNYIINKINDDITLCENSNLNTINNIYFIHIREIDEIYKLKKHYNNDCITILIDRKNFTEKIYNNVSDDNLFKFKYDFIIKNDNDIEHFKNNIKNFINNEIYKS